MTWRAAKSLTKWHAQLKAKAPRAVKELPGSVWGLRAGGSHAQSGGHFPHPVPGLGQEIVTAADAPNAPSLGLDIHAELDAIRRSKDPRVKYAISNDQMFSSYAAHGLAPWTWRPYNPGDPSRDQHRKHGHLEVVEDARADDTRPWATAGAAPITESAPASSAILEEDDMPLLAEGQQFLPLCIPPARTRLHAGGDFFSSTNGVPLRIWVGDGLGGWNALPGYPEGIVVLMSGRVASVDLPQGTRLLSISRWGLDGSGRPAFPTDPGVNVPKNPVSLCLERI